GRSGGPPCGVWGPRGGKNPRSTGGKRPPFRAEPHRSARSPPFPARLCPSRAVRTLLLVSSNEALRARLTHGLGDRSVFFAASDEEALKTLRVTQVEAVVKEAVAPLREVPRFLGRVRQLCPGIIAICILG